MNLDYDLCSERLVAACQDAVFIIDTCTHSHVSTFPNGYGASITGYVNEAQGTLNKLHLIRTTLALLACDSYVVGTEVFLTILVPCTCTFIHY